jgi:DNA-binding CsgD family transcriptional regulator
MLREDSMIIDLVKRINALSHRNWLQEEASMEALRDPGFEDFLIKANQGIALSTSTGFFYYVSKSLGHILGHPIELIYERGPAFLQELIRADDKLLVEQMIEKSEDALTRHATAVTGVRVSFDYHIVSGKGDLKRVYQHMLPSAVLYEKNYYTLFIIMDLTGFKTSPQLNYRVSYLTTKEKFETIAEGRAHHPSPYAFTKREFEILKNLAQGKNMDQLAAQLFISIETLKKHRRNILDKTDARNMVALIDEGLRDGWILNIEFPSKRRTKP